MREESEQADWTGHSHDLAVITWFQLMRLVNKIKLVFDERLQEAGLSPAQYLLIRMVGSREGLSQQDYAERLNVTKGAVSQLITKLEKQSLLERKREGYINHLFLTDAGRDLVNELLPYHDAYIREKMSGLSPEKLKHLWALLRELERSLD